MFTGGDDPGGRRPLSLRALPNRAEVRRRHAAGETQVEIAAALGVTRAAVKATEAALGIERRPAYSPADRAEAERRLGAGVTVADVSRQLAIPAATVRRWAQSL